MAAGAPAKNMKIACTMQASSLLGKIVGSFGGAKTDDELERLTSTLLEEVRSLLASDRQRGAELAERTLAALTADKTALKGSTRRRAFARYMDAFVDGLGVEVCSPPAMRVLLDSSANVTQKEESVVATEVLLGVLGSQQLDASEIWEQVWEDFVSNKANSVGLEQLLKDALVRFPGKMYPILSSKLKDKTSRMGVLHLLCAASLDETLGMAPVESSDTEGEGWNAPVELSALLEQVLEAAGNETRVPERTAALLAGAGLVRRLPRAEAANAVPSALSAVQRGLGAEAAAVRGAAARLFFLLYAVSPESTVSACRLWATQGGEEARMALHELMALQSLPLHPALLMGMSEEISGETGADCWDALAREGAGGAASLLNSEVVDADSDPGDALEDWAELEAALTALSLRAEELAARAGMKEGGGVALEGAPEQQILLTRLELQFERVLRRQQLMAIQRESNHDDSKSREQSNVAVRGSQSGALTTQSSSPISSTSSSLTEVAEREEYLRALLNTARMEAAHETKICAELRQQLFEERKAREEERREFLAAASKIESSLVDKTALEVSEQRVLTLEADVSGLRKQVRVQQEYERELADLQAEIAIWDQNSADKRAEVEDGRGLANEVDRLRKECLLLENLVHDAERHTEMAQGEATGAGAVVAAAKADSLRLERTCEDLRKRAATAELAARERITAVEKKYSSLQELQAGLLLQMQHFNRREQK